MDVTTLSGACLLGHSLPRSLRILWERRDAGDTALEALFRMELLTDRSTLAEGYSDAMALESPEIAANVRAHRTLFEELGFFARVDGGDLLAFWYGGDELPEPAVVKLDTEGQYSWHGINLSEALFRAAEDIGEGEDARAWLAEQGLACAVSGELGVTTQYLPDLKERHARLYADYVGRPRSAIAPSLVPLDPRDPTTWLLRPAAEVKRAMTSVLGHEPTHFFVWTTGEGLVRAIKLGREAASLDGIAVAPGASRAEVAGRLSIPTKSMPRWDSYEREAYKLVFHYRNEIVDSVSIQLLDA